MLEVCGADEVIGEGGGISQVCMHPEVTCEQISIGSREYWGRNTVHRCVGTSQI